MCLQTRPGVHVDFTPLAEVIEQTEQAVSLFKKNREFFLNKYLPLEAELEDVFTPAQMTQWTDDYSAMHRHLPELNFQSGYSVKIGVTCRNCIVILQGQRRNPDVI